MANNLEFDGKVVLITGSSAGLGASMAKAFAKSGARVVITGRNSANVENVAKECDQLSPTSQTCLQVVGDVTKDEDLKRLVDSTVAHYGSIDILVNNAGSAQFTSIYDPQLMDKLDDIFRLDVRSVVSLTHLVAPHLEKTKGVIINISAVLSLKPNVSFMAYCMAKAALDMFTKCVAIELGQKGIRVNSVNPTAVRTNFQAVSGGGEQLDKMIAHIESVIPLRRIANHDDVSNAVLFLSSRKASFITGTVLFVDGGNTCV